MEKPVINLELCQGSFRIPTSDAVYHITVCGGEGTSATRVVERIVETEGEGAVLPSPPSGDDDYYKEISNDVFHDIGQMAKNLSASMMSLPAEDRREKRTELNEAGEKIEDAKARLRDIVAMTEKATMDILDQVEKVQDQTGEVKDLLSFLKNHKAFQMVTSADEGEGGEEEEAAPSVADEIAAIRELVAGIKVASSTGAVEPAAYEFDIDTVMQTMYELCTNEAVKSHINTVREKAGEIFDQDGFSADLNERIAGMNPDDDNFLPVPLSELLAAMAANCSDATTVNLLKNIDKNRAAIFLDDSIPLEARARSLPPESGAGEDGGEEEKKEQALARLDEVAERVRAIEANAGSAPNMSMMTMADQAEIFAKIEDAFSKASGINVDTSKITEVLSFQDLSGQQIMKIIKLLSDFQVQLLALVVSFGSRLKSKEKDTSLTVEESRKLAQEEVDRYLGEMNIEEEGAGDGGKLDQEKVNDLLEKFGF